MDSFEAVDLGRDAIRTCLMVGGPILLISLLIGVGVGVLQTMTQVQDQTVSFVPKLIGIALAIGLALPWLSAKLVDYTAESLATPATHRKFQTAAVPVRFEKKIERSETIDGDLTRENGIAQRPAVLLDQRVDSTESNHSTEREAPIKPDASPYRLPHYRFSRLPKNDQEL